MKRIFISLALLMLSSLFCFSQTIDDYNNDNNRSSRLTYDEQLNPTVELSLTNRSSKAITTIEFVAYYKDKSRPKEDISSIQIETTIVQFSIPPKQRRTVHFRIPKGKGNSTPFGYIIKKVGYEDGTICQ